MDGVSKIANPDQRRLFRLRHVPLRHYFGGEAFPSPVQLFTEGTARKMIVYPVLELSEGRCARLAQGRFDDAATYLADPVDAVLAFEDAGAEWAHIVDLDGAREGGPRQHGLIADIALSVSLKLQVAGGFRERAHFQRLFDAGADRVVVAALAVEQPELVRALLDEFGPDHIAIALDIGDRNLRKLAEHYPEARHLLLHDGAEMLQLDLVVETARRLPNLQIQVDGAIASLDDLRALGKAGAAGAIVGSALWDNHIGVREAIAAGRA